MTYLGNSPTTQSFIAGTDYFNGTGSATAFTLSRSVVSVNDIQATVNNVVQVPNDAYTVSGTTITFTSAPSAGTNNVYVRYLSTTTQSITPSQGTVSWSTLNADVQQDLGISFKNRIINGNMIISQRYGTTNTAVGSGGYVIDRWGNYKQSSTGAYSVQQSSASPVVGFIYSDLITITTAANDTGSTVNATQQYIEGNNCADLGWGTANAKTVTLSFWAKSSLTGNFSVCIQNASFNRSFVSTYSLPTANTWTYCTITITGCPDGTWATDNTAGIGVWFDVGSGDGYATASTNSWLSSAVFRATGSTKLMATNGATLNITGVQLEVGTQATTFDYRSYGTELQLCQRYFYKNICATGGQQSTPLAPMGWTYTTSRLYVPVIFPQPMRSTPTLSKAGGFGYNPFIGGVALTDMVIQDASNVSANIQANSSAGFTNNTAYWIGPNTVASDFIAFSAEL